MKVAFISRSTLFSVPGGDTIQVLQTAKELALLGVKADVLLTNDKIDYNKYDLFHFFNITRPSDVLYHIPKLQRPFVISPVLVDYSEYDRLHRKGLSGFVLRQFSRGMGEYIKTVSRWIKGKDILQSKSYLWKGHDRAVKEILGKAAMVLPNSELEYSLLEKLYGVKKPYVNVPYGIDPGLFEQDRSITRDEKMVICVARIEGRKNQFNLIKALNNSAYTLLLIGPSAPNQQTYFEDCKKIAAKNIHFIDQQSQSSLAEYYNKAKVHVLPSWFESCGLTSLEAAIMGCTIVITDKGFTREYYGDHAFYCNPGDPASIFTAIEKAANSQPSKALAEKIMQHYTWQRTAEKTLEAYNKIQRV